MQGKLFTRKHADFLHVISGVSRGFQVGVQQCLRVSAAFACVRAWRAGLTVLCVLVPTLLSHADGTQLVACKIPSCFKQPAWFETRMPHLQCRQRVCKLMISLS
jgi:hypothetical protein